MVNATADSKGKAKADPRDDLPLRFRTEEHTSAKEINRYRRCRPNSGALIGMYAPHHQRQEEEEERDHERCQCRKQTHRNLPRSPQCRAARPGDQLEAEGRSTHR